MLITRAQFDQRLVDSTLKIAFIGMSNIGKSFLSKKMEQNDGFACIEVDKAIETALGLTSMAAMAKWLGYPYESKYQANTKAYLKLEGEISLAQTASAKNTVLDTTGSVIHLSAQDQEKLKNQFLMIYLKASQDDLSVLIDRYFRHPKPTIWTSDLIDKLNEHVSEAKNDALIHYYPQLLKHRAKLYEQLADITIPAAKFTNKADSHYSVLARIRDCLPD